jgi:hypothetical protein
MTMTFVDYVETRSTVQSQQEEVLRYTQCLIEALNDSYRIFRSNWIRSVKELTTIA